MTTPAENEFRPTWNPANVFTGTAYYYARYRPRYPVVAINLLVEKFKLSKTSRVLDLGCGPGHLALALAPHAGRVFAVDPQEEMLAEGRRLAGEQGVTNIEWISGESGNLSRLREKIGAIDLTVMGRSFHWMDQQQTLNELFKMTLPGGGVALIGDSGPTDGAELPWKETIQQTVKKWLGDERKAGTRGIYRHPPKRFEGYLKESDFSKYKEVSYKITRSWTPDEIVGYMYSTSLASLPVLGDKKELFEADLRRRLQEIEPTGLFKELVTINIMMVWKGLP
jgi:ubiquinone/menaquinone biosynthesis C-methylase UbiE